MILICMRFVLSGLFSYVTIYKVRAAAVKFILNKQWSSNIIFNDHYCFQKYSSPGLDGVCYTHTSQQVGLTQSSAEVLSFGSFARLGFNQLV
jgi:hypothetical protein